MRNVLAATWSPDGLLAFVTRAAWRGTKNQVHVVDAADGFAPIAKLDIDGDPEREQACLAFAGHRLLAHVGIDVVAWDARTAKEVARRRLVGWVFALYPDGRAGVNSDGELRLEEAAARKATPLGFSAQWLTPLGEPAGDWAVVEDDALRRVTVGGKARWKAKLPAPPNELEASPTSVVLGFNGEKRVLVFDATTGMQTASIATKDQVGALGVRRDGTVWILERQGRFSIHQPTGALVNAVTTDVLCMRASMSPDESMLAVENDLLELRSCLRVVSTATGKTLWDSKVRAAKVPAARASGATISAKDGKLLRKGVTKPLGTYKGEVQLAIAKDGSQALVVDESGVRVFDLETGACNVKLSAAKVEEETIDPIDKPLFDAEHRPCVKVGRHKFLVEKKGVVAVQSKKPAR
jgi:hypothetical protein